MKLYHVGPITVSAIGGVVTLATVTGFVYLLIGPAKKKYDAAQARYLAAAPGATPGAMMRAKADLADAKAKVQRIKFQWAYTDATKMPRFDASNRVHATYQLDSELTQTLGPDLERHLRQYHGKETAAFSIPPPPTTPNAITAMPFAVPLGTVTSRGTLLSVLSQFRDWQYFHRVVMLDNLAIHGNSPYVQATYDATVYLFPQNDDKLPPILPEAGGDPSNPATGAVGGATVTTAAPAAGGDQGP